MLLTIEEFGFGFERKNSTALVFLLSNYPKVINSL